MRKHFASAGSVQSGSDNWDPSLKTLCRHFAWHAYETKIWYVKLSRSRWQLEFFAIMKLFVKFLRNESESLWRLFHKNSCSDNCTRPLHADSTCRPHCEDERSDMWLPLPFFHGNTKTRRERKIPREIAFEPKANLKSCSSLPPAWLRNSW